MPSSYISVNGKAKQVTKAYIGVKGVAKEVNGIYFSVSGLAKQVYANGFYTKVIPLTRTPYGYCTHTKNNLLFTANDMLVFGVDKKGINFDCGYLSNGVKRDITAGSFNGYAFFAGGNDSSYKFHKEIEFFSDSLVKNSSLSLTGDSKPASAVVNDEYLVFAEYVYNDRYNSIFTIITKNLVKTSLTRETDSYSRPLSATSYGKSGYFNLYNNGVRLVEITENLQYVKTNVALSEYEYLSANANVAVTFDKSYGTIRSINTNYVVQVLYKATYGNTRGMNGIISSDRYAVFSYKFVSTNCFTFIDKFSMVKKVTNLKLRSGWSYPIDLYGNYIVTTEDVIDQRVNRACTLINQDYFDDNNEPLSDQ